MVAISDSTTLIILLGLNKMEYLENIFKKILIPKTVYEEISYKNSVILPNFIKIKELVNRDILEDLNLLLDKGESEAIALALQEKLPLIIDEKRGRKVAMNLNIKILGLLGVLYLNVKKGFAKKKEIEDFLKLAIESGYRISDKLINEMLDKL